MKASVTFEEERKKHEEVEDEEIVKKVMVESIKEERERIEKVH